MRPVLALRSSGITATWEHVGREIDSGQGMGWQLKTVNCLYTLVCICLSNGFGFCPDFCIKFVFKKTSMCVFFKVCVF
jgi:hypothetical protein